MNLPTVKETGRTLAPVIIIFAFAILMTIVVSSLKSIKENEENAEENKVLTNVKTGQKKPTPSRNRPVGKDVPDFNAAIRDAEKYFSDGKKREAETVYRTLLIYYEDEPALLNAFAVFLYKIGKYDESEYYFRRLDVIVPDDAVTVNNIAITCVRQKKYDEAEKLFEKSSMLNPDFAAPEMNLAGMYSETGKIKEAEKHFAVACERLKKRVFVKKDAPGVLVSTDGELKKVISGNGQDK